MQKNYYVDSLMQGIKAILSENRCSLTDDDKVLLTECLAELQRTKNRKDVIQVIERIAHYFVLFSNVASFVKDLL